MKVRLCSACQKPVRECWCFADADPGAVPTVPLSERETESDTVVLADPPAPPVGIAPVASVVASDAPIRPPAGHNTPGWGPLGCECDDCNRSRDEQPVCIAAESQLAGGELPMKPALVECAAGCGAIGRADEISSHRCKPNDSIPRCGCPESKHLRAALERIRKLCDNDQISDVEIMEISDAALKLEPLP